MVKGRIYEEEEADKDETEDCKVVKTKKISVKRIEPSVLLPLYCSLQGLKFMSSVSSINIV